MRIISGTLKGKSINYVKNFITRPLKDSVKENIFNILEHSNFIKTKIKKLKTIKTSLNFIFFKIKQKLVRN